LVNGLNNLGINASDYHLQLSETTLIMMGLDIVSNAIQDLYFNLTQQTDTLNLSDLTNRGKQLDTLAAEIYTELLIHKR
jgi:hypothetical protein